jgi:hypothetical protein
MEGKSAWLHIAVGTVAGIAIYNLIIVLIPSLNPATIASKLTTASTPSS